MSEESLATLDIAQRVMEDTGFELVNSEKLDRVVNGVLGKDGALIGGIGAEASSEDILANYDRVGGLIRRNGDTVRTGSFWDFKRKAAHKKPQVEFVYRVNGRVVYVPDGTELPGEVKAAKLLADDEKRVAGAGDEAKPAKAKRAKRK